jgi:hypothetical protein
MTVYSTILDLCFYDMDLLVWQSYQFTMYLSFPPQHAGCFLEALLSDGLIYNTVDYAHYKLAEN